ncbi:short-chain dehydrogenase/reductase [Botrytis cinerea]
MSSSVSSLAPGNTALITGGASGIGFSFAEKCVKAGLNVILVDNNGDNLGAAQMYLSQLNGEGQVVGLNVDVGVEEKWESIKDVVEGDFDAAVKTLAEHLSFDLREKKNIGVHLLVPGWTYTGLTGSGSPFIVNANEQDGKVEKVGLEKKPKGAWSADQVTGYLQEKMGEGKFYIVCPDGDVSEEMDRKRMAWGAGDIVQGRLPLSRWREEYKSEFEEFIKKDL